MNHRKSCRTRPTGSSAKAASAHFELAGHLDEEQPRVDHAAQETRHGRRDQPVQATTGVQEQGEPGTPTSKAVIMLGENFST